MKNILFNYCEPVIDKYGEVEGVYDIVGGIADISIGIVSGVSKCSLPGGS